MPTTKSDIKSWINIAKQNKAKYLLVVVDTFDYEDYPIECMTAKECWDQYDSHNGKNMQRVMEVYDLTMDIENQINQGRAFNLPKGK